MRTTTAGYAALSGATCWSDQRGTFENSMPTPSAIVGCARWRRRDAIGGARRIAICTTARRHSHDAIYALLRQCILAPFGVLHRRALRNHRRLTEKPNDLMRNLSGGSAHIDR